MATFHCVGACSSPRLPSTAAGNLSILMGGHMYPGVTLRSDDNIFAMIVNQSKGGDVLVLTADPEDTPCDLYNDYIYKNLSVPVEAHPNSVTTICFQSRAGAMLGAQMN